MTPLSRNARVAGLLYIAASAIGVVRLMVIPSKLFVSGNASATAANLVAHEALFRLGIVSYLVASVLFILVTLSLYRLLKEVDRTLAVMMVVLGSLIPTPIFFVNSATDAAALLLARGAEALSAIDQPRRDAFAMLFLQLHHHLDLANAVFWGLWLIPFGLLVYRSGFLPRILGVWLLAAFLAWLAFSFAGLLFPGSEAKVLKMVQPLVMGEVATMLWLAVIGARERPAVART